jgi:hypothetical protein
VTISSYTSNFRFGLIDFNSQGWHEDEWNNWKLIDALLAAAYDNIPFVVASGTPTAITLTYDPAVTAYTTGLYLSFQIASDAAGATTVNVNGLGAKTLKILGQAVEAGDFEAGDYARAVYNGTDFILIEPIRRFNEVFIDAGGSGGTAHVTADNVVVDASDDAGVTILTPVNKTGALYFGDSGDARRGGIKYDHTTDTLSLLSGGKTYINGDSTHGLYFDLSGATDFRIFESSADIVQIGHGAQGIFLSMSTGNVGIGGAPHATKELKVYGDLTVTGAFDGGFNIGAVTGILAIANGGTGADDIAEARSNLGLGALSTLGSVNDSNWSGADLTITNGGTGASSADAACDNLGAVKRSGDTVTAAITRSGAGAHVYMADSDYTNPRIYIQASGAMPSTDPGTIVFEY